MNDWVRTLKRNDGIALSLDRATRNWHIFHLACVA